MTLSVTIKPKLRSSGSDDEIRTANPPMVVSAEVKKARPVRRAAVSTAWRGGRPCWRSSMWRPMISTENSATVATTSGPETVVSGLSVMSSIHTRSDDTPIARNTGTKASSARPRLRVRSTRYSPARPSAR